ncbi:MAG: restriction endonuclease, partial [Sphingobacteriaceae bacterium]
ARPFEKLKEKLIELKIPAEQIRIKTANLNEIRNEDLLSKDCPVRYIITVNALKEGWDCPFAYILASLADKSSAVDVEQILGRVLRQPYVMKHNFSLLNLSYVLTASAKFLDTLDNIVKGLNKAGFSDKDYKVAEAKTVSEPEFSELLNNQDLFSVLKAEDEEIDVSRIADWESEFGKVGFGDLQDLEAEGIQESTHPKNPNSNILTAIEKTAIEQTAVMEKTILEMENTDTAAVPNEIQKLVKNYPIKEVFAEKALQLQLPAFYLKVPSSDLFGINEALPLEKEDLLKGFALSKADTNITFDSITSELYKVDLDETKKEHTPTFVRIDGNIKESLMVYLLDPTKKDSR